jgi:hypothetical protein
LVNAQLLVLRCPAIGEGSDAVLRTAMALPLRTTATLEATSEQAETLARAHE